MNASLYTVLVCCFLYSYSLSAQDDTPSTSVSPPLAEITFPSPSFEYGMIEAGERVVHTYHFSNTGTEPLVLSAAKGSCGCTVPEWPKEPILPGESGEVVVEFDSTGKKGRQNKRVTIIANTDPPQTFLSIHGDVSVATAKEEEVVMPKRERKVNGGHLQSYVVYPNPAREVVHVKLKEAIGKRMRMVIYDELGRVMEEREAEEVSLAPVAFEVSAYPSGTYRVLVQVDGQVMEAKAFMVVKN